MAASPAHDISALKDRLAHLSTVEEKVQALWSWNRLPRSRVPTELRPGGDNPSNPAGDTSSSDADGFSDILGSDSELRDAFLASLMNAAVGPQDGGTAVEDHSVRQQPCANVDPSREMACENPGSSLCSSCRLVRYCSKVWPFLDEYLT